MTTYLITFTGLTITNFKQIDKSYCDDVQTMSNDISDLVKFDEVMQKFESTSGAILSRNNKSKVMGVGLWKSKQDWPEQVRWMKVVTEMKIFGFTICSTTNRLSRKLGTELLEVLRRFYFHGSQDSWRLWPKGWRLQRSLP